MFIFGFVFKGNWYMALVIYFHHISSFYLRKYCELCLWSSRAICLPLFPSSLRCSPLPFSRSQSLFTRRCKDSIKPSWVWVPDLLFPRLRSYSVLPFNHIGKLCCSYVCDLGNIAIAELSCHSPTALSFPVINYIKLCIALIMYHEPQPLVVSVRVYWTKSILNAPWRRG